MRRERRKKSHWKTVGIVIVLLTIIGASFYVGSRYATSIQNQSQISRASSQSSTKSSQQSKQSKPESFTTSSPSKASQQQVQDQDPVSLAHSYIIGKGFSIVPELYDGEDVNQAMTENKAPQNSVHDGVLYGYFKDANTARLTGLGAYVGSYSANYTVDNHNIVLKLSNSAVPTKVIPYTLNVDGTVLLKAFSTDFEGHTLTSKVNFDEQARAYVDQKQAQN
ncbi:hypothetical protein KTT66_13065 [Lacticaseibacillus casei]|jgi:hypothetical protein|uniref:Uncharacterized protein n=1 Tax=Lacticaseibacillus huelsenbergensis TaxID=3035291 RepID=A0ABY8DTI0_9LACO|nr:MULTISPECIES: hypothetical protein [Lacticaseibacillus]MDG3060944.1 hypothetical protein [Lacticaseibacillus sp. BCRC 81376]QVI37276.1 hypothetical protein KGS74_13885 [Lacticaseibacillus casei]QXG59066.1 hypothetical protein KTT66_13065 [Lacticaseibacillus casei]WFB39483.1 hypothetical protein LHUE1_000206 [Lacticaseibacillus huelsenbergensis]WFB41184.1 hypothetical protein LHUE2_001987 [Lacticaseibacillus huelsenbergensis]